MHHYKRPLCWLTHVHRCAGLGLRCVYRLQAASIACPLAPAAGAKTRLQHFLCSRGFFTGWDQASSERRTSDILTHRAGTSFQGLCWLRWGTGRLGPPSPAPAASVKEPSRCQFPVKTPCPLDSVHAQRGCSPHPRSSTEAPERSFLLMSIMAEAI